MLDVLDASFSKETGGSTLFCFTKLLAISERNGLAFDEAPSLAVFRTNFI